MTQWPNYQHKSVYIPDWFAEFEALKAEKPHRVNPLVAALKKHSHALGEAYAQGGIDIQDLPEAFEAFLHRAAQVYGEETVAVVADYLRHTCWRSGGGNLGDIYDRYGAGLFEWSYASGMRFAEGWAYAVEEVLPLAEFVAGVGQKSGLEDVSVGRVFTGIVDDIAHGRVQHSR